MISFSFIDSSKLDETVAEFHQLGFDLVAMVIDCDVGMPEDDFEILLKVQTHFESFLDDIVTFLKQGMGEEDLLKSNGTYLHISSFFILKSLFSNQLFNTSLPGSFCCSLQLSRDFNHPLASFCTAPIVSSTNGFHTRLQVYHIFSIFKCEYSGITKQLTIAHQPTKTEF